MSDTIDKELLTLAAAIAYQHYTPTNNGVFDYRDKNKMTYTPENIKAVYDELFSLFYTDSMAS